MAFAANALARSINDAQPMAGRRWQWSATSDTAFDDVLVYVHRVGSSRGMVARRVEWTPRGGYEESVYRK